MLSPSELSAEMVDQMSMELPKGKAIVDVFADFMRYLYDSTEALFKSSEPNVKWDSISVIELVLTHPNGWKGPQQSQLRTAAVKAGLIQDTPAEHARVHFVSEGEASFNFCATNTQAGESLKVCLTAPTQSWFFDALAARRASSDHRCGRWNDRHQHLQGSQEWAAAGRRAV